MEDQEMITLWRSYNQKLDQILTLNQKNAQDITRLKIQSLLGSMRPIKIFTIVVGVLWVSFVDILIVNLFFVAGPFFIISAIIQVLLSKIAIGIYLYHLILIGKADISEAVVSTQEKLARLKSSTILTTRLLFLQLPVWTTFYWNRSMLENGNLGLFILQIAITLLFTFLSVWLFRNIRYENHNKKWFRLIFRGKDWDPVIRSMEMLDNISEFKMDR